MYIAQSGMPTFMKRTKALQTHMATTAAVIRSGGTVSPAGVAPGTPGAASGMSPIVKLGIVAGIAGGGFLVYRQVQRRKRA